MVRKMYSIRDAKGEVFNPPWVALTNGEAERNFTQLVRDPQSQISRFPEDYDLYFVGEFDDSTGKFRALDTPTHLVKAIQFAEPVPAARSQNLTSVQLNN